jgi:type IV secretory pathway ATPase VirB11/archaellum biosynthesis ATPase
VITQNEVYDMAMKTALHIMATPHAGDVVTKLERLILDAYERGMHDTADKMMANVMQSDIEDVLRSVS